LGCPSTTADLHPVQEALRGVSEGLRVSFAQRCRSDQLEFNLNRPVRGWHRQRSLITVETYLTD